MWTVAIIKDMVSTDAPNIKDCVILGPGSAILFFSHHQEPREGLYLHEAQELAEGNDKDYCLDRTACAPKWFSQSR